MMMGQTLFAITKGSNCVYHTTWQALLGKIVNVVTRNITVTQYRNNRQARTAILEHIDEFTVI